MLVDIAGIGWQHLLSMPQRHTKWFETGKLAWANLLWRGHLDCDMKNKSPLHPRQFTILYNIPWKKSHLLLCWQQRGMTVSYENNDIKVISSLLEGRFHFHKSTLWWSPSSSVLNHVGPNMASLTFLCSYDFWCIIMQCLICRTLIYSKQKGKCTTGGSISLTWIHMEGMYISSAHAELHWSQ